jgi:4-amino-4-deoxy-L-arabinose transferase-like glycosyltransferase
MFYPEVLNLLVATAALTLSTWMLVRRRLSLRWLLLLGAVFGFGQLVRASNVFVLVSVAVAFMAAIAFRRYRQHLPLRTIGIAIGVAVAVASPWYIRQAIKYHTPPLIAVGGYHSQLFHPAGRIGWDPLPFWKLSVNDVYNRPVAPFYNNEALPMLYTEIWGDYFGYWAWANYSFGPSPGAVPVLRAQTKIGILPTGLAIAGWLALWGIAIRRRGDGIPIIPLLLLPLLAVGAVMYRAYATPSPDGDLLKASYALISVPAWAIGFGVAVEWVSRRRLIGIVLGIALLVLGFFELRFMLYGIRDHFTIF